MERTELEEFRRNLNTLLQRMEHPFGRRQDIAVEKTPDKLDEVQNAADRELAIRKLEFDSSRMRNVRTALDRIREGTYGTCLRCDEEISLKRLRAVPWASYCLACQDAVDQEQKTAAEEFSPEIDIKGKVA